MKLKLLCLCATLAACSTNVLPPATGQFTGPESLAITSAGDRDFLFVASAGADELRVLQMCTVPADDPTNTCPAQEDFQFLPGPIRVFPGSINVNEHPIRLAGVRLCTGNPGDACAAGGATGGIVLVAGTESRLGVVDAHWLLVSHDHGALPQGSAPVQFVTEADGITAPPIDVIAVNAMDPAGTNVELPATKGRAYAVLRALGAALPKIVALDLTADANGFAQKPTVVASCDLPGVDPRRLASAHGDGTYLYIADGSGDGAVRVTTASMTAAGGACDMQRIPFGAPLRSVAVSPTWYKSTPTDADPNHYDVQPAGQLLAGITMDGALLFARTSDAQVLPVPSQPWDDTTSGVERMEPLLAGGSLREIAFLDSTKCTGKPPCTALFVGDTSGTTHYFDMLAVATSTDGGGYFVEPLQRRFVNSSTYNTATITPALTTSLAATDVALEDADPSQPGGANFGWFNAGVTQANTWSVIYHGAIPGLERRGGNVTVNADGTMTFATLGLPLSAWQAAPISLRAGDVLAFYAYYHPDNVCPEFANETPLRVELPITAISGDTLTLAPVADANGAAGFHPSQADCPSFGAVAEFHTAADQPWLVETSSEVRTRLATNEKYFVRTPRFDYPLPSYGPDPELRPQDATRAADIEFAFHVTRTDPAVGTTIQFTTVTNQLYTAMRDPTITEGFATAVTPYTSRKVVNLTFMTLTGANSLIQADPLNLGATGGTIAYR